MKLLLSTGCYPETEGLSANLNKIVIHYPHCFATLDQACWNDCLPFAKDAYVFSEHHLTMAMPCQLDLQYEPPLQLDLIEDLLW
jgi:hypothetical protein